MWKQVCVLLCSVIFTGCASVDLRLSGGAGDYEGNVEVLYKGEWKYICDDRWDLRDAKVVCRLLNFSKALSATTKSHFKPRDNVSYWLDDVTCWGSEANFTYCWNRGFGKHNCEDGKEVAGVVCSNVTENDKKSPIGSPASKGIWNLQLRLDGKTRHGFVSEGLLEVFYDGVWGAVCSDGWDEADARVACGNLGYPGVSKHNIKVDSNVIPQYWMTFLKCTGLESTLGECDHAGMKRHTCSSGTPVRLECRRSEFLKTNRFDKASLQSHVVRLRSGYRQSEGRVEVKHLDRWGSICDDEWDLLDANVVCRQMGFGTAFEATHGASFGQGMGKVWLDDMQCNGTEKDVRDCKSSGFDVGDCGHVEDAGVKCHYPYSKPKEEIRVIGGPHKRLGRIEVQHEGKWYAICGMEWGPREAEVVCREAGLGYARRGFSTSKYGMNRKMAMYNVKCSGDELSIKHCKHAGFFRGRCRFYEMASVECSETAPDLVMDYRYLQKSVQLQSESLMELGCAYEENCLSGSAVYYINYPNYYYRTLLRFSSRYWNRGTANFIPNISKRDWTWHSCHQHYHSMERFSDYDLIDVKTGLKKVEGHKASFCLEDTECEDGVSKFFNCTNRGDQGVSVGCADNYKRSIDCQWVDVTDLSYGNYTLRVIINPLRDVPESDYSNNIVTCKIEFRSQTNLTASDCTIDPCEQMAHGGTSDGGCCVFPFTYKKKQYHSCTTDGMPKPKPGRSPILWCATTGDYDKDKLWGKC